MNFFTWLEEEKKLTNAALTVLAQAIPPNDNGRLLWDTVMPRQDIPSVDISQLYTLDFRPAAERREWNAPARPFALPIPKSRDITVIPVEMAHKIEEYELQKLAERAAGVNQDIFRRVIGAQIPDRVRAMALANYRRIELEVFRAWLSGNVTVRNPADNSSYVASYGIDASRYATAGTAWSDVGVNAYNELLAWARDVASGLVGGLAGVMLRQATMNAIAADAPVTLGSTAGSATLTQVEQRLTDALGTAFRFAVNERTVAEYTRAEGWATTNTKVFTAQRVAAIPASGSVGSTGFAPVLRAMEVAGQNPDAGIDVNGMTAYRFTQNQGKELEIDVQCNPIPLPNEQAIAVINVGV